MMRTDPKRAPELTVYGKRIGSPVETAKDRASRRYSLRNLHVESSVGSLETIGDGEGQRRGGSDGNKEVVRLSEATFPIGNVACDRLKSIREAVEVSEIEGFLRNSIRTERRDRTVSRRSPVPNADEIYGAFHEKYYDHLRRIVRNGAKNN